jgi:hypothetical protein
LIAVYGGYYPKKHSFNNKYNQCERVKKAENEHFDPLFDDFDDPREKNEVPIFISGNKPIAFSSSPILKRSI